MPNIEALRDAVEWVEREDAKRQRGEPSEWCQRTWFCGSAYCVAVYIALKHGYSRAYGRAVERDGKACSVFHAALGILKIMRYECWRMVDANNTAADIRRIAEEIAGCEL